MKREEELMTNFQDLQGEVDDKVKIVNKLRKRYKAALSEIKDLEEEHQTEKSDLLESIRNLERDLDFYKVIVNTLMKEDHLYRIKAKSRFDIEINKWIVPPFIFKAEEVNFPKLKANRIKELIDNEKDSKVLEIGELEKKEQSNARKTGNFKGFNCEKYSNSHNSIENNNSEDLEDYHAEDIKSPSRIDNNIQKGYNSIVANSDFLQTEYKTESKISKDRSQENITFNTKGLPMKQKTLKRAELAAKVDKSKGQTINQPKLPPSIRWVSTDDDPDSDFFKNNDKVFERNPKAIAQLAPLSSNHRLEGSSRDRKSGFMTEPNEARISGNDLIAKKGGRLRPLRD